MEGWEVIWGELRIRGREGGKVHNVHKMTPVINRLAVGLAKDKPFQP